MTPPERSALVPRLRTAGALGLLALALAMPPSAWADETTDDEPALGLSIASYDAPLVGLGGSLTIRASVTNGGGVPETGLVFTMAITAEPLEGRDQLDPWVSGALALPVRTVATRPVGTAAGLAPMASTEVVAVARPADLAFPADSWDVYGVELSVSRQGQTLVTQRTFVTFLDRAPLVTPVTVVVVAAESATRVEALLGAAARPEVTLVVDPRSLDARARGALGERDVYALPAWHLDIASIARAGNASLLDEALALSRANLPSAFTDRSWIAVVPELDVASAALAADRGATAILVSPSRLAASSAGATLSPGIASLVDDPDGAAVILPDAGLSAVLAQSGSGRPAAAARIVAESALVARSNTAGTHVVVATGSSWSVDPDRESSVLAALLDAPWIDAMPLSQALASAPRGDATPVLDVANDTDIPPASVTRAGSALRGLDALAAATGEPAAFAREPTTALLRALSFDRRADPDRRAEEILSALVVIDGLRASVSLPEGSAFNLLSASGRVPIAVRNDLDVEVTVTVVLESRSAVLRIAEFPTVTLEPLSTTQVLVPVTAVSSGNVVIRISLANAEGLRLAPAIEVTVRVRAEWGYVFTIVLGLGSGALLVAGIFRTVRRGRRDTRVAPSADSPLPGDNG